MSLELQAFQYKFAYLAPADYHAEVIHEIGADHLQFGNLFFSNSDVQSIWALDKWSDLKQISIQSIGDAQKKLKALHPLWDSYVHQHARRANLITDGLRKAKPKAINFLDSPPPANLAAWTLLETDKIVLSLKKSSPFFGGTPEFNQDKIQPPSRAYLKLWELFTVYKFHPRKGQKVLDFGSCPGGWTWVLQKLGCEVWSVDRSPLDPKVAKLPHIHFIQKDAFKLDPHDFKQLNWFCSDIICDPNKLYEFVLDWKKVNPKTNFVCTLKFKGHTDFDAIKKFQSIKGSRCVRLHHNKHEIMWFHQVVEV